jgi:hypothetical protein
MLWIQQAVRSRRVDLRKIRGEVNPADLFTKHLPSAEKVGSMVRLHGCAFASGRASTAPMTRTTETGKKTIAEADLNAAENEHECTMPHLEYNGEALDMVYPSVSAPKDVEAEGEHAWESWDQIAERGKEIVEEIRRRTVTEGRRRREGGAQEGG